MKNKWIIKYKYKSDVNKNLGISFSKNDRIQNQNKDQIHKYGYKAAVKKNIKKILKFSILFLIRTPHYFFIWSIQKVKIRIKLSF